MNKRLLKELKQKLKEGEKSIEEGLGSIAKKDPNLKDDWDSYFPKYNGGSGGQILEDGADQVEEYSTRLPIEYSLEVRLKDINSALEKIEKATKGRFRLPGRPTPLASSERKRASRKWTEYGICEKCGKKISIGRLKVCPEAKFCIKCEKK